MNYPKNPNELDWGSMSKAEFKRAELHYEYERERQLEPVGTYEVWISGKKWKDFYNHNQAVKAANTIKTKYGKTVEVFFKRG